VLVVTLNHAQSINQSTLGVLSISVVFEGNTVHRVVFFMLAMCVIATTQPILRAEDKLCLLYCCAGVFDGLCDSCLRVVLTRR